MDLELVNMPLYTGLTAALLTIIQIGLMLTVIKMRGDAGVFIGSGGNDGLERIIRAHGNFIENVPTFLVCLMLIELMVGSTLLVALLGGVVLVARLAHAIALSANSGVTAGRLVGTLGTVIPMLVAAGYLVYQVVSKL
ncbi:MAG: MAPEG family protein [Pseudomonadales bacterium]|jgi:uncharacterized membrane protein YecN with MAPEG domain|tara:strand:- start:72 stop:485 length:414 start_codon:yes stop_codon:yes gene_type:complete